MEIVCESCKAKLNIPDEKVPQGKRVSVACPRCKNKLIIDTTASKPEIPVPQFQDPAESGSAGEDMADTSNEETYKPSQFEEMSEFDDMETDSALDSYEEGEKLALVMVDDTKHSEKIKTALDELEYNSIRAENTQEAVAKMRFQNFDLVILSDLFDNIPLEQSPIFEYLNHLSMSFRRKMFVVLIGDKFRTMDHMMAFTLSANLVVNGKELKKLSNILRRAISENEKFYKVFMDTLVETGKA